MSITAAGSNYMSNTEILAWMEQKTDAQYGQLRDAMDVANTRTQAETDLNKIKADLIDLKTHGGDASAVRAEIDKALSDYGSDPDLAKLLTPMSHSLADTAAASEQRAGQDLARQIGMLEQDKKNYPANAASYQRQIDSLKAQQAAPKPISVASSDVDNWSKDIGDSVDALGKKDQLGLIDIQEINSEINQAKQTASALLDSADKSANAIINHIA